MILFQTRRLLARPLEMSDAGDFLDLKGDPEVARYEYWEPFDLHAITDEIEALASRPALSPGEWSEYALVLKQSGAFVGTVSLKISGTDPKEAEIGFKLIRRHQRRGYATEGASALLSYAFTLGVSRVIAVVDVRNLACIAVLERIGMKREKHLPRSCFVKGEWCDEYVYAVARDGG